jgi:hypothetical protein
VSILSPSAYRRASLNALASRPADEPKPMAAETILSSQERHRFLTQAARDKGNAARQGRIARQTH